MENMKKNWVVCVSQNSWEYCGYVNIKAIECKRLTKKSIIADGVEIEFDEEFDDPYID